MGRFSSSSRLLERKNSETETSNTVPARRLTARPCAERTPGFADDLRS